MRKPWPKCDTCDDDLPSEAEYGPRTCGTCLAGALDRAKAVLASSAAALEAIRELCRDDNRAVYGIATVAVQAIAALTELRKP